MDEKTEELREIFTSVTDEETVTESQEADRGSLGQDDRTVEERVEGVVEQLQDRYAFETPLSTSELVTVVYEFYEGASDEAIADELGVDAADVFEARTSLHLISDDEVPDIDLVALREREADRREASDRESGEAASREADDAALAAEYDVSVEEIERYRAIAAAQAESRAANDRYRDEFDSLLADADLTSRMAADVREDGLEDATEGMETDVSF